MLSINCTLVLENSYYLHRTAVLLPLRLSKQEYRGEEHGLGQTHLLIPGESNPRAFDPCVWFQIGRALERAEWGQGGQTGWGPNEGTEIDWSHKRR